MNDINQKSLILFVVFLLGPTFLVNA